MPRTSVLMDACTLRGEVRARRGRASARRRVAGQEAPVLTRADPQVQVTRRGATNTRVGGPSASPAASSTISSAAGACSPSRRSMPTGSARSRPTRATPADRRAMTGALFVPPRRRPGEAARCVDFAADLAHVVSADAVRQLAYGPFTTALLPPPSALSFSYSFATQRSQGRTGNQQHILKSHRHS